MRFAFIVFVLFYCSALCAQEPIPPQDYTARIVAGWTVMVSPTLLAEEKEDADSALSHLLIELIEIGA